MAIPILGGLLILSGIGLVVFIFARKIPEVSQIPQEDIPVLVRPKIIQWIASIDWSKLTLQVLRALETIIRVLRKLFFFFLRTSEHWIRGLSARSRQIAGEAPPVFLPKFLFRIKRRKAFVEEERKLLEWLTQHPDDFEAYRRLGNLYTVAGNIRDARASFEQALKLRPDDDEIKRHLDELAVK